MLEAVWRSLDVCVKLDLLDQLRAVLGVLRGQRFDGIGGVELDPESPGKGRVSDYWRGYKYGSEVEFFLGRLQANIRELSVKFGGDDKKMAGLGVVLDKLKKRVVEEGLVGKLFEGLGIKEDLVLCHNDFAFRNIMVRRKEGEGGMYEVAAILDWEWAGAFPDYGEFLNDWLEEVTEEDKVENAWIRNEMERDGFKAFSNFEGVEVRSAISSLCIDSLGKWRFDEGDDSEERFNKNLENIEKCLDVVESFLVRE
ncbi:UNVERIFIED_CONTAM: hypothetical protein HDU68_000944 [Siphonaria sp. JEL0065]|nr:hypothetical protein HDU68_000944 [Siphonaria sp. JEL0065]